MKDLNYTVEVLHPKDESKLIDNYTEAVFNILKNRLSTYNIEQLILQIKDTAIKKDICTNK